MNHHYYHPLKTSGTWENDKKNSETPAYNVSVQYKNKHKQTFIHYIKINIKLFDWEDISCCVFIMLIENVCVYVCVQNIFSYKIQKCSILFWQQSENVSVFLVHNAS